MSIRGTGAALAALLLALLTLPLAALLLSAASGDVGGALGHPSVWPALWLSVRTTAASLVLILLTGTPLAWWLATTESPLQRMVSLLVDLPIVLPPAVLGVALLQTFGRGGWLGPALDAVGISLPFTSSAVVLAQVIVAAPFFVQAARTAFSSVDPEMLIVAQSLGASPAHAWRTIALPLSLPGLVTGASLAWARALGEFGATLLFAGNLSGTTQTLPLAIFTALESDLQVAVVLSALLAAVGVVLLLSLRWTRP